MFLHIVGAAVLLALSAMNYELDKADAAMRAEPVPSTQAALDARETVCDRASSCDLFGCDPGCDRFVGVPVVVGPDGAGWTDLRDSEPPSTRLLVCGGSLPATSLRDNADGSGCHVYDVGSTDRRAPDLLNRNDDDEFRHVYYESGDPACVGTGKPVESGRDCGPGEPQQCAYISEGFSIYAVTGGSCSQHTIGLCTGPFCR